MTCKEGERINNEENRQSQTDGEKVKQIKKEKGGEKERELRYLLNTSCRDPGYTTPSMRHQMFTSPDVDCKAVCKVSASWRRESKTFVTHRVCL